jgi:hypothetical protein
MKVLTALADRMVNRLVPQVTAAAAPCEVQTHPCWNGSRYTCWYDNCEHVYLSCQRTGSC